MNFTNTLQKSVIAIHLDNIKTKPQVRSLQNKGFEAQDGSEAYPNNAVQSDDSIEALASSIRSQGLQNPIIVRPAHIDDDYSKPVIEDCYIIVSGERRYRATQLIQKQQQAEIVAGTFNPKEKLVNTIDAIVKDYSHDSDIYADQLTENIQRVDLTGFEVSDAIMNYKKSYEQEHPDLPSLKREDLAKTFGKSLYWVSQMTSFAELDANDDKELISLFKEGVISRSPRAGYELIKLYRKDKQTTLEVLYKFKDDGKIFDRGAIPSLKAHIEKKKNEAKQKASSSLLNELPGLSLSSTEKADDEANSQATELKNDPKAKRTQEDTNNATDDLLKKDAEAAIKSITLMLEDDNGELHSCALTNNSLDIKESVLDLIIKLKNRKDIQIKLKQGFEVKVSSDQIKRICIDLK
ncbi:MAG TPA: ParB N-terminal domain-containing protein [Succinivibrionaceae bacterium]|nr:ParB N-terminal domain-containing protein [Succinivibrionaceae bacterium]